MTQRDVLILEDDSHVRSLLETLLARGGLTVLTSASCEEALELLGTCEFSAVIVDVVLPQLGGRAFLEQMSVIAPQLVPRVVLFTAATETMIEPVVETYPVYAVLRKPSTNDEILSTVYDCLLQEEPRPARKSPRTVSRKARAAVKEAG